MSTSRLANRSFVLLKADWDVEKAVPLIESLAPTHIIVHRRSTDLYYLYTKPEALHILKNSPKKMTLDVAFDLHEDKRTPTFQATDTMTVEGPAVILYDKHVTGFVDVVSKGVRGITRGIDSRTEDASPFNLVADFPQEVKLGKIVSLLLSISVETKGRSSLPISLPRNSKIDIVVQPKEGFELDGESEGSIIVKEGAMPLQFKLKATQIGAGKINIFAFHKGQPLGLLKLDARVTAEESIQSTRRKTYEKGIAGAKSASQPDLSLVIFEHVADGKPALTFRLSSTDPALGLNLKKFGPVSLQIDAFGYFEQFFQDIENLPLDTARERVLAEKHLEAKGMNLFKSVLPKDLQVLLWSLKDRISSVQIQSEEPWIPWEICKLQGIENGRMVEGPFLCEGFSVTRWLPEVGFKTKFTAKKMGLVVPTDSGLPYAASEKNYLLSLAKKDRKVEEVPARLLELTTALSTGEYDVWHFSGHGGFRDPDPDRSGMLLEKKETLTPEHLSGVVENLGLKHPIVFLNACQIGRSAMSLTGIGGWAAKFLQADAGAFIGAYWSVYDKAAHDFAKELYSRLFSGVPIGRAAKEARLAIRPLGDPTWLAYTVFADPFAAVA